MRQGTHLRRSAEPCSCDRSTGVPSRARDRSACCRFVSYEGVVSRRVSRRVSRISGRAISMMMTTESDARDWDASGWKDEKKRTRREERRVRHAGSVAQVVTGAVAGGRLARTLRRDARRRSIFDRLLFFHLLILHRSSLLPAPRFSTQSTAYPTTSHPSS